MKYEVSIRKVEDCEFWDVLNYPEEYIEEDCPDDAVETAKEFIWDCGGDPDKYDYLVKEYDD